MGKTTRRYLTFLFLAGAFFGLVFSPPVLSIGLMGLMIVCVLDPRHGLNPRWRERAPDWFRRPFFWAFAALYLLLLAGAWQTYDWAYYLERLRIKLPLLLLPFAWPGFPALSPREERWVLGGFAAFVAVVLAGVLVNYALHFAEINRLLEQGRSVPVPRNHIRFSLLVGVATLVGLRGARRAAPGRRWPWLALAGFLFLGQHLLAVRSGLVGVYGGLAALLLVDAVRHGRYRALGLGMAALVALPVVAYLTVPTFRSKVNYARYELFHRSGEEGARSDYSDTRRLTSIGIGMDVWRDNHLVGVGPGNLRAETDRRYRAEYGLAKGSRPHNQFVSALAGSGLLGYLVTLTAFLIIGLGDGRWRAAPYLGVWTLFVVSCLAENTLENSAGVSMFCLFLLLLHPQD